MKIFRPLEKDRALNTMFVTPASLPNGKGVSEWVREDGSEIMFTVEFKYGMAHVHGNLGRIMVDNGLAALSPVIVVTE